MARELFISQGFIFLNLHQSRNFEASLSFIGLLLELYLVSNQIISMTYYHLRYKGILVSSPLNLVLTLVNILPQPNCIAFVAMIVL